MLLEESVSLLVLLLGLPLFFRILPLLTFCLLVFQCASSNHSYGNEKMRNLGASKEWKSSVHYEDIRALLFTFSVTQRASLTITPLTPVTGVGLLRQSRRPYTLTPVCIPAFLDQLMWDVSVAIICRNKLFLICKSWIIIMAPSWCHTCKKIP